LITLFNKAIGNLLYSGLLLSNLFFILSIYFFQKLIEFEKSDNKKWVLSFFLIFPTSFYFGAYYSESLFLLLTLLSFLAMRKKKWWLSAIWAGLASATRLVGIFIFPALIWEFWTSRKQDNKKPLTAFLLSLVSLSGFILYCLYLKKNFGDPFYFAKVQNAFGASRETDRLILLHQVVWRYLKMVFTVQKNSFLFFTVIQEFLISIFALVVLLWGIYKRVRPSYLIYSFMSFLLPTLTGNFSSMPRYIAVIFPIYFILGELKNRRIKIIVLLIFFGLLIINTAFFLRGFWIA